MKGKNKTESQTSSSSQAGLGDIDIEESISHKPVTSKMIVNEVKKQSSD